MRTDRPETAGGGFRAGGSRGRVGSSTYGTSAPKPKPAPKGLTKKKAAESVERALSSKTGKDPLKGTTAGKMRRQERWSSADNTKNVLSGVEYNSKSMTGYLDRTQKATSIKKMNKTQSMLEKKEFPYKRQRQKTKTIARQGYDEVPIRIKGAWVKVRTVTPKSTKAFPKKTK